MRRIQVTTLIFVGLLAVTACASPAAPIATELPQSSVQFTKITAPLTLDGTEPGTDIPYGSVIYHWANGITEVYGPDNNPLFIAKDSEAALVPHPSGPEGPFESPATHMYQVPSGTRCDDEAGDGKVTKCYLDSTLILTIIVKSEDYKY